MTRVLLVDDEPVFLQKTAELLENEEMDVVTARTLDEAEEKIRDAAPDAIVSDVLFLPERPGVLKQGDDWLIELKERGIEAVLVVLTGQDGRIHRRDRLNALDIPILRKGPSGTERLKTELPRRLYESQLMVARRARFYGPLIDQARELMKRWLRARAKSQGGMIAVGDRILTPEEALREIDSDSEYGQDLIRVAQVYMTTRLGDDSK
ncbi:MAG TPA: response regulator [Nitrospiraceae bacterium]|nr:response regulator [Nitrospiraceae bacterium]